MQRCLPILPTPPPFHPPSLPPPPNCHCSLHVRTSVIEYTHILLPWWAGMKCVSLGTRGRGDIGCLSAERQSRRGGKEDKAVGHHNATLWINPKIRFCPWQSTKTTTWLCLQDTYQEVKHTQTEHVKCEADVSVVVKPVQHPHTEAGGGWRGEWGKGGVKGGEGRWEEGRTDKGGKRTRGLGIITFNTSQQQSNHLQLPHVPTQLHACTPSHSPLPLALTLAHHPQCLGSVPRPWSQSWQQPWGKEHNHTQSVTVGNATTYM